MPQIIPPRIAHRSSRPSADRARPQRTAPTSFARIALLALLASCEGCQERTPNVCCTSDTECAELGLPPGSVADYGCGQGHVCRNFYCVTDEGPDASAPDAADAPIDAPSGRCNPAAPFGPPNLVPNVSSSLSERGFSMTADELTAFITRAGTTEWALLMATRTSTTAEFSVPMASAELAAVTAVPGAESGPWPTKDALVLYYTRQEPNTGSVGVFASYRTTSGDVFTSGSQVRVDSSPINGLFPQLSADGQTLYWLDFDDLRLYSARNHGSHDAFVQRNVTSTMIVNAPVVSGDELTLYYAAGSVGQDVFASTRATKDVPFGIGLPAPNVNSTESDTPLFVTSDGCWLFLESNRPGGSGGYDIWVARKPH